MMIPDEETACKVAEAIWLPIYGSAILKNQPFNAILIDDVWKVTGSVQDSRMVIGPNGDTTFHVVGGGVPYINIFALNGEILNVGHSR